MSDTLTVNKAQLEEIAVGICARYLASLGNHGIIPHLEGTSLLNAALVAKKLSEDDIMAAAEDTLARFEAVRKSAPVTKADLEKLLSEITNKLGGAANLKPE